MVIKTSSKTKRATARKTAVSSQKKKSVFEDLGERFNFSDKKVDPKKALVIAIAAIIVIAIIVAFAVLRKKPASSRTTIETTVTKEELKDKLNVEFKEPVGGNEVAYGIENNSIAKISYKKKVSDGNEMNFIMRSSYSTEEIENSIGLDVEFAYTPIMMTVICNDGSEIPVESKVALEQETDEMRYMKALWFDNDKYYSMVTDNLVTREDFLQEVNRVIIANHENF